MFNFFAKRFGYLLLTMVAVSLLVFVLNEYSPGQVARKILGPYAEENSVVLLTEQMGLNRPVVIRYVEWLWQILHGNLGKSTLWGVPVNDIIWGRLLHTLIFHILSARARSRLKRRGFLHTSRVFGLLQNARVDEDYTSRLLSHLPAGDSELYSHPSLDEFRNEFEALVSPRVRQQVKRLGIKLIRYQDL